MTEQPVEKSCGYDLVIQCLCPLCRSLVCGDDELISSGQNKYRTISVLSEIDKYNLSGTYYFLVKYNNSSGSPMDIPYKKELVLNKEEANGEFRGDFIKEITISDNIIEFDYIIGAKFTNNTYDVSTATEGIEYKESYSPLHYFTNMERTTKSLIKELKEDYKYELKR